MSATKPAKNHPWRSAIKTHVAESNTRNRIQELEKIISEAKAEMKILKEKMKDLMGGKDGR